MLNNNSNIRQLQNKDYKTIRYICSSLGDNLEISSTLFCDYYMQVEPEVCFVAVDEFDNAVGCILATKELSIYKREYIPFLAKLKRLSIKTYKEYTKLSKKIEELGHDYPSHFTICLLPAFQNKGYGKQLVKTLIKKLKEFNIKGMNIILDKSNKDAIAFFERIGFIKYKKISSTKYIYICNI